MKININMASLLGMSISLIVVTVGSIFLQVSNPDMTNMRLFLTYWKFYVSVFAAILTLFILFKVTE